MSGNDQKYRYLTQGNSAFNLVTCQEHESEEESQHTRLNLLLKML